MAPGLGASTSPWKLVKMHVCGPHPRPKESKLWKWGSSMNVLTSPPGNLDACFSLKNAALNSEY